MNAMATIETNEGRTLIVERRAKSKQMWLEARVEVDNVTRGIEMKMFELYKHTALETGSRPRSRGDLTADKVGQVADLLVGRVVADGTADRRSEVKVRDIRFQEREEVKRADAPIVPSWEETWPGDGSASEKVRWLLDEMPTYSDEEIAVVAGCSRSLVSDIKSGRGH